jgi:hypothetical protein
MHGNKNTLFLVMIYSALFNNAFKALNNKYVAEIQLPGYGICIQLQSCIHPTQLKEKVDVH